MRAKRRPVLITLEADRTIDGAVIASVIRREVDFQTRRRLEVLGALLAVQILVLRLVRLHVPQIVVPVGELQVAMRAVNDAFRLQLPELLVPLLLFLQPHAGLERVRIAESLLERRQVVADSFRLERVDEVAVDFFVRPPDFQDLFLFRRYLGRLCGLRFVNFSPFSLLRRRLQLAEPEGPLERFEVVVDSVSSGDALEA